MNNVTAAGFKEPLGIDQSRMEDDPRFNDALWAILNQAEPFNKHSSMRQIHALAEKILLDHIFRRMHDALYAHFADKYSGDHETIDRETDAAFNDAEVLLNDLSLETPISDSQLYELMDTVLAERAPSAAPGIIAKRRNVLISSAFKG